jgi:hypothetical protein
VTAWACCDHCDRLCVGATQPHTVPCRLAVCLDGHVVLGEQPLTQAVIVPTVDYDLPGAVSDWLD